jgi:hypothetical protein
MVDPLIIRIIALGFSLLFFFAALHKLGNREQFAAILTAYKILPSSILKPISLLIPFIELALSLSWLTFAILQLSIILVPIISLLLLGAYTFAIGINLLRGRIYIDCGCGFAKNSGNDIQQLSSGLIIRNSFLILATVVAAMSSSMRELGFIDHFALLMATIALTFVYASYNQIISNRSIINTWRNVPEKTAEGSHA